MSRPSLVSVVVAVAITTGVSCAGAESDELSAQSKPLTGVALVTINPKGYKGPICVGSLGCTPPTGLSRAYDLAAGTYALSASYTVGLDAETSALGTMTVS
ncbi:MAG TPA: hypothetical protein VGG33_13605, partial [Polyangia bacterium]